MDRVGCRFQHVDSDNTGTGIAFRFCFNVDIFTANAGNPAAGRSNEGGIAQAYCTRSPACERVLKQ